jgi:hypothetical protein
MTVDLRFEGSIVVSSSANKHPMKNEQSTLESEATVLS